MNLLQYAIKLIFVGVNFDDKVKALWIFYSLLKS